MVHGGGGQGTHMMGIGGRPGWVHYFVQAGYSVYWIDRPSYGRSPYHPDALGPSHLPNVPALRRTDQQHGRVQHRAVARTRRHERSADRSVHGLRIRATSATKRSIATWSGAAARNCWTASGRRILLRPRVRRILRMGRRRPASESGEGDYRHGDQRQSFRGATSLGIDREPDDLRSAGDRSIAVQAGGSDRAARFAASRRVARIKLQAEPAHKWKNLQGIPIGWLTSEFGGGGSPVSNVAFLRDWELIDVLATNCRRRRRLRGAHSALDEARAHIARAQQPSHGGLPGSPVAAAC